MHFCSSFTIESDTRYLSVLRQWVAAFAALAGAGRFPKRAVPLCTLALIEAVNNAIFHAHGKKRHLPITVMMSVFEGAIVIEVIDLGKGIGHHLRGAPDAMISHGRGLFLMHRLMTKVESRLKNNKHSVRMTRKI